MGYIRMCLREEKEKGEGKRGRRKGGKEKGGRKVSTIVFKQSVLIKNESVFNF